MLLTSARAFSKILTASRIPQFDVIFGPAYKGISLAAITCMALGEKGIEMGYCYNRKEKKDVSRGYICVEGRRVNSTGSGQLISMQHGEGGSMVGAPLKGRVVILDDVLTRGTAIREAIDIIKQHHEAELVGIVQLVDREERGQGESGKSTVQEVEEEFGVPVEAVLRMRDIMTWMQGQGGMDKELQDMTKYREQYGIQ